MGRGHRLHVRPVPRASREDQALAEELPVRGDLREAALDAGDDRGGGPRRDPARRADRGGPRGGGVMKDQAIVEAALFSAGVALIAYHQPVLQSDLHVMVGDKVYEHTQALEKLGLINRKPEGRSLALTTTRYFSEFFGLKATDREGIRKLLAEKVGVAYTVKPKEVEAPPEEAPPADAPAEALPPTGPEPQAAGPG